MEENRNSRTIKQGNRILEKKNTKNWKRNNSIKDCEYVY